LTGKESITGKMEGLEEQLRNAAIPSEYAAHFLKQVQTFRAQLNLALCRNLKTV